MKTFACVLLIHQMSVKLLQSSIVVVMKPTSVALRLTGFLQRYEYILPSHMTGDYSFDRVKRDGRNKWDQDHIAVTHSSRTV